MTDNDDRERILAEIMADMNDDGIRVSPRDTWHATLARCTPEVQSIIGPPVLMTLLEMRGLVESGEVEAEQAVRADVIVPSELAAIMWHGGVDGTYITYSTGEPWHPEHL